MRTKLLNVISLLIAFVFLINCANRGRPQGGEKDSEPPKVLKASPENYATNFSSEEIRIYFDEYVKLQNIQKQLIISPPMETQPEVLPLGTASKYITIKIFDTLQPNTTYAFNFGQSVVDNNEGNPYPFFRYVFSTGDYIDSLTVKGNILDAEKLKPEEYVSVMLYEMDSTYTDSIIYKKNPKYITNTLDSVSTFTIENVKEGTYKLIALKDENQNNTFQQKSDKIGFLEGTITVPTDTLYDLSLFKEEVDFKVLRGSQVSGSKIAFGFEGDSKNMEIELLDTVPENYKYRITKDKEADTLYYWHTPKFDRDSLLFNISNKEFNYRRDSLVVKMRDMLKDTLVTSLDPRGTIKFEDFIEIAGTTPFEKLDKSQIIFIDKDTLLVDYTYVLDTINNKYILDFDIKESQKYLLQLLPGALTDMYENVNDTIDFALRTKQFSDYGNVRVTLQNAKYPVIVQLTDEQGEVKAEKFSTEPEPLDFRFLDPKKYYIRVVFDANGNQKWDSGSFLEHRQPERISYFPELLDVRAGWDLVQTFTLE
ncbi:MAG: Ig-like domain-containing protein [Flavobacteriaceae bacterium]|nr:Ig-like domain-containing protein [Flavobacteriaceae bacterium]